jgi:enamine deaminase RidA (YjgF/YER057c/UK114 family)
VTRRLRCGAVSERQCISSGGPWELIVGYCRAVRVDNQVWVSGTAPQWPDDSVDPDPAAQARRCFEIIESALTEAGATLEDVVRTRMFLTDPADFDAISRVHGELLGRVRPANTTLVVAQLMNPAWKVEIEVDALIGQRVREPGRAAS